MHWSLALLNHREKKSPLPWDIGISKDRIAAFYKIKPEERPHRAMNGVDHLIACYQKIVGFAVS
jgi:DNA polymerase-3 subunit epsilon/oligoribonuclease